LDLEPEPQPDLDLEPESQPEPEDGIPFAEPELQSEDGAPETRLSHAGGAELTTKATADRASSDVESNDGSASSYPPRTAKQLFALFEQLPPKERDHFRTLL
jgi:hypothetical protein